MKYAADHQVAGCEQRRPGQRKRERSNGRDSQGAAGPCKTGRKAIPHGEDRAAGSLQRNAGDGYSALEVNFKHTHEQRQRRRRRTEEEQEWGYTLHDHQIAEMPKARVDPTAGKLSAMLRWACPGSVARRNWAFVSKSPCVLFILRGVHRSLNRLESKWFVAPHSAGSARPFQ